MVINVTNICFPQKGIAKKGHAFAPHNHKYARKLGLLHLHELLD